MGENDDLINSFIEEAREHLPIIEASLLSLENKPEDPETLNELFRSVHTIKGGAGFFGLNKITELTHGMESLLSLARANKLILTDAHIDVLLLSEDRLVQMIDDPSNSNNLDITQECRQLNDLIEQPNSNNTVVYSSQGEKEKFQEPTLETFEPLIKEEEPEMSAFEDDEDADSDLKASFLIEARECLPIIERCLLGLESNSGNIQQLNELFRNVHTVKGGACFLGLTKIAELTHIMEDVLGLAKRGELLLEGACIDTLLEAYDCLVDLLEQPNSDKNIESLCQRINALKSEKVVDKPAAVSENKSTPPVVEIAQEEKITATPVSEKPLITPQKPEPLSKPKITESEQSSKPTAHASIETEETIRVHVKRLNKLIDLAGELVLVRNQFFRMCEPLIPQSPNLKVILHNFNRITSEMQEEIMSTRMQPVGIIFNKFPRLIRQLEKDLHKKLELVTEGAEVELDRTIIESLSDPVTHIIRNMADHGIETPEERIKKGKPPTGTLLQKAFHESGQVVIQFSDDGAGIDPEFIAQKALEKGIINASDMEKMSPKDKLNLVFTAGFSTAKQVTSVSGRGIGMDVVKTNIEQIGGTIDINSEWGKWTSITMTLPLTMAIIAALIVQVKNCRFAFPQGNLDEMVLLEAEDYADKVANVRGQRVLCLRGNFLPLISLAYSFNMPTEEDFSADNIDKPLHILIIKSDNNRVAVIVDEILGGEEIVVKPMPEYFKQIKNFSGTSILGDGAIAMIIDVQGYILKNQLAYSALEQENQSFSPKSFEQEPQSLLIFDNNTEEHFALALSWIQRIDTLDVKRIQIIAGIEYIEYRGEQVRLLRLEHCLPVQKPNNYAAVANIIIPKHAQVPVALLINKVIDTKNAVIKLENSAIQTQGILGSMLLDGKITLMLDLHSILELGEPESVEKIEINPDKAKNKHILLVEDTPFFMKVIKECVTEAGYRVTTAINGHEGLETLKLQNFDLVLSDIEMPIMDGREMVKNIRANSDWDNMPVIALTTLNDKHTIAEGKKAGFNEWLVKLDKELVLKTLAAYL